ncbi:MAG: hypothetical protein ACRDG4_17560 [Chloroflexota bacterium]
MNGVPWGSAAISWVLPNIGGSDLPGGAFCSASNIIVGMVLQDDEHDVLDLAPRRRLRRLLGGYRRERRRPGLLVARVDQTADDQHDDQEHRDERSAGGLSATHRD